MKPVTNFTSMADLRCEIDALDCSIVAALARRVALIDRAVVLKPDEGLPARIESRIEAVIENVRGSAQGTGLDPAFVEKLWRDIIEWSIAREEKTLGTFPSNV